MRVESSPGAGSAGSRAHCLEGGSRKLQLSYRSGPSARTRARTWLRLAAPSLPRMWLTCLTVSSAAAGLLAICWFRVPRSATPAPAASGPSAARPRSGTIQMSRAARPGRDPAEVQVAVHRGGHHGRQAGGHPAGPCRDRRRRRRVAGQAATMTAGIQPTAMMGAQLCCLMASTIELTATNTAASAAIAYSHRIHGLMSNIPSVKCPCHDGPACGRSPELSALPAVIAGLGAGWGSCVVLSCPPPG